MARWVDCRDLSTAPNAAIDATAIDQRQLEAYDLAGWCVVRRRDVRQLCPRDEPLADWVARLRTKLLSEDL